MDAADLHAKRQEIVKVAKAQFGKPYVYGTQGPRTFDCSGFVDYVYARVGLAGDARPGAGRRRSLPAARPGGRPDPGVHMSDGYWRIKQYSPTAKSGFTVTTIPIAEGPAPNAHTTGPDVPYNSMSCHGISFLYPDGHVDHYPWASIIKAEYQPPTEGGT